MKVSVEISMYPLKQDYIPPIQEFIDRLNTYKELEVRTNCMSTQVFGDYDSVMEILTKEMKSAGAKYEDVSFVMKMIPKDLSESI